MTKNIKTLSIRDLALLKSNPVEYYRKHYKFDEKTYVNIKLDKSYSHKPYLAKMPYDRNSRHPLKMCARYMALEEYENELKDTVKGFNKEFAEAQDNYNRTKDYVDECQKDYDSAREEFEKAELDYEDEKSASSPSGLKGFYRNEIYSAIFGYGNGNDGFLQNIADNIGEEYGDMDAFKNDTARLMDEAFDFMEGVDETGYCDEEHAKKIDVIMDEVRNAPTYNDHDEMVQQQILENLENIKDNTGFSPDDHYPTFDESYPGVRDKMDDARENLKIAKDDMELSKKQMSGAKKKAHERNVALYEVANEKQNCEDIFDDAALLGDADNPMPSIDEYIKMTDLKSHVDKNGEIDVDYLTEWERDLMDSGYWESGNS